MTKDTHKNKSPNATTQSKKESHINTMRPNTSKPTINKKNTFSHGTQNNNQTKRQTTIPRSQSLPNLNNIPKSENKNNKKSIDQSNYTTDLIDQNDDSSKKTLVTQEEREKNEKSLQAMRDKSHTMNYVGGGLLGGGIAGFIGVGALALLVFLIPTIPISAPVLISLVVGLFIVSFIAVIIGTILGLEGANKSKEEKAILEKLNDGDSIAHELNALKSSGVIFEENKGSLFDLNTDGINEINSLSQTANNLLETMGDFSNKTPSGETIAISINNNTEDNMPSKAPDTPRNDIDDFQMNRE